MSVRFCKDGHLILIKVKNREEIHYVMLQGEEPPPPCPQGRTRAARRIQAWWRGLLVRRALLHAALRAWTIQRWWRQTLQQRLHRRRREALVSYAIRERAVVKLQSLVRMWRVHWRYCQVLNAIYVIRGHWQSHHCQTCALLRGHCVVTATHLQFHIEITNP
ncbi:IQ domain-containing protein F2-like [Myotis myotis]|uniref:IQ domain-containing protein F2-like n=1 Tax=Myotis myotis TaxID=51298 RepID=UPI00174CA0D1|nr:IQ domain-containing protein F2-like [Myotis myotis]